MSLPNPPRYALNNSVTFNATIVDINGNLATPSTVIFQTAGQDGITYTAVATPLSLGQYTALFVTATPTGRWHYRFVGTGRFDVQTEDIPYIVEPTYF